MIAPKHWLTSAEIAEALQYATGSLRLTAAIVMARELLDERDLLHALLREATYTLDAVGQSDVAARIRKDTKGTQRDLEHRHGRCRPRCRRWFSWPT